MFAKITTVTALVLSLSGIANAADYKIVYVDGAQPAATLKIAQAAKSLCEAVIRNDSTGEFGAVAECVADSVSQAHHVHGTFAAQSVLAALGS